MQFREFKRLYRANNHLILPLAPNVFGDGGPESKEKIWSGTGGCTNLKKCLILKKTSIFKSISILEYWIMKRKSSNFSSNSISRVFFIALFFIFAGTLSISRPTVGPINLHFYLFCFLNFRISKQWCLVQQHTQ